jgi:hypothetical protein
MRDFRLSPDSGIKLGSTCRMTAIARHLDSVSGGLAVRAAIGAVLRFSTGADHVLTPRIIIIVSICHFDPPFLDPLSGKFKASVRSGYYSGWRAISKTGMVRSSFRNRQRRFNDLEASCKISLWPGREDKGLLQYFSVEGIIAGECAALPHTGARSDTPS